MANSIASRSISTFSTSRLVTTRNNAALILAVFCLSITSVDAQQLSTAVFRSYNPKHVPLKTFARSVQDVLSDREPEAQVLIDAAKKRVMVQGSQNAHRLVKAVQDRVDRPAQRDATLVAQVAEATLRSYTANNQNLDDLATDLRAKYESNPSVKIAVDPRTKQLLIHAPVDVHQRIAGQIRGPASPRRNELADAARRAVAGNRQSPARGTSLDWNVSGTFQSQTQLKNLSWKQLVKAVQGISPKRLALQQVNGSEELSVVVPSKRGGSVFRIDPRTGGVKVAGSRLVVDNWMRTIAMLDKPAANGAILNPKLLPVENASAENISRAVALLQAARSARAPRRLGNRDAFAVAQNDQNAPPAEQPEAQPDGQANPPGEAPNEEDNANRVIGIQGGLTGAVEVRTIPGLDAVIITGRPADIDRLSKVIQDIEDVSARTEPQIEILPLEHVSSDAIKDILDQLESPAIDLRQGEVSITSLVKPNSLLLIGSPESVRSATNLIKKLDQPVEPQSQFQVFRLKHIPSDTARTTVESFFAERGGLSPRVQIQSDFRSNSLIVHASPRDLAEVEYLLQKIDVTDSESVSEVQIFKLKNSSAAELADLLNQTLRGQVSQGGATGQQGGGGQQQQRPGAPPAQANAQGGTAGQQSTASGVRSSMLTLQLKTLDAEGKQLLKSGILTDVVVTADTRTNSLVITAPKESMGLIKALVEELDQLPTAEAQIDVFTIINGDATTLTQMLQTLFGQGEAQQSNLQPGLQTAASSGESSLVPLRFATDIRSNSIIATGSSADLAVVDTILTRLDESDVSRRESRVFRLLNAPAQDVATAINGYLDTERQVIQTAPQNIYNPYASLDREVVVVPEIVSNSLIISATPRYFTNIEKLIKDLDARPPMVLIQVLIAEVSLDNTEELGFELGIQDSLLFDRSIALDSQLVPGFNFNNLDLGSGDNAGAAATREKTAGQALTNFAVGRNNSELGYGGLVLSASSESISVLVRALQESGRLDVLSRPQVMTLNNQPASVLVGALVPYISGTTLSTFGQQNQITQQPVGLSLGVTPRISPDGLVVMEIDAIKSSLGSIADGIPISINDNGDVVRSPIINTTQAQTTVSARSGQTIVLGGLISKERQVRQRQVPVLGDIPVVGSLFRFDSESQSRTELLFIMTPYVVRSDEDVEWVNQVESQRMSWCLSDVVQMHGDIGFDGRGIHGTTEVIYPDQNPLLHGPDETIVPNSLRSIDSVESSVMPPLPEVVPPQARAPKRDSAVRPLNESGDSRAAVVGWDSVREFSTPTSKLKSISDDRFDDQDDIEPPKKTSRTGRLWSKIRGRRVEKTEGQKAASFISPVHFIQKIKR